MTQVTVGRRRRRRNLAQPAVTSKPKKKSLFGGKKKNSKLKSYDNSNVGNFDQGQSKLTDETEIMRTTLTGPAKLIGQNELSMLVKMNTSHANIEKRLKSRLILSIAGFFIALIAGVVMKQTGFAVLGGFVLAGFLWLFDQMRTSNYFLIFQLKRQIAFSQFIRLAAAYLPEMQNGTNLYSIFYRMLPRLNDKKDRAALQKLMVNMSIDPDDPGPFLDFAHDFSVSDRAETIMLVIHDMYRGNVNDKNIRSLADQANEDMIRQCDTIVDKKLKRFSSIDNKIGIAAMVPIFVYLCLLISQEVGNAFGDIGLG